MYDGGLPHFGGLPYELPRPAYLIALVSKSLWCLRKRNDVKYLPGVLLPHKDHLTFSPCLDIPDGCVYREINRCVSIHKCLLAIQRRIFHLAAPGVNQKHRARNSASYTPSYLGIGIPDQTLNGPSCGVSRIQAYIGSGGHRI